MIISHNMASINTNRQLGINQDNASKSLEKLSSGFRINKAGDDAAGLAISEKMRGQIRGLDQASRNAQDGISMIQTAEGSLSETQSILQRMKELATQSANDTNVTVDRGEIQKEMNQLTSEINRIGNTTEFNTQKLLKGKDAKVVATEQTVTTNTAGIAGVVVGAASDLVNTVKSVVASQSSAEIQGNTSKATGTIGQTDQTTASVKGVTSVATLLGLNFTSTTSSSATPNGGTVTIMQVASGAAAVAGSCIAGTVFIGTRADGHSAIQGMTRGEVATYIKGLTGYGTLAANVSCPEGVDNDGPLSGQQIANVTTTDVMATNSTIATNTYSGGVTEVLGVNTFTLTSAIKEAGDTVTIGGKIFTAKATATVTDLQQGFFSISGNDAAQAASLAAAVSCDATLSARFSATTAAAVITLQEHAQKAEGTALASVTTAGNGKDDKLQIIDLTGRNMKTVVIQQGASDSMSAAADAAGNLTITLATSTASKNAAEKIQAAVNLLSPVMSGAVTIVDFSKYKITSTGDWDTKAIGDNNIKANATITGGTLEAKGSYSFDITKAFGAGDTVNVKGQIFTCVTSGAIGSKNEFNVAGGVANAQASSLRNALAANDVLNAMYTAGGTGSTLTLTEINASGVTDKTSPVVVKATGTAGEYSVDTSKLLENGAAFVLDGKEITVSNKTTNVGYDKGTAIKVAATGAEQTAALAAAINKNADLSAKYKASVDTNGNLLLNQIASEASDKAPVIATKNSSIGEFTATLQIGANAGQSMTVNVNDMRAKALFVSGDGTDATVAAKDGKVASYVATQNVTNGTDNTSVEFSLDVSDHDKATNAISVISDAIEAVSAERSKLGAFQNRLDHTISNLGTSSENMTAAESRIRDVDMAKEMMTFQKNNILQQAATAMMAQANQLPQGVLQLLR